MHKSLQIRLLIILTILLASISGSAAYGRTAKDTQQICESQPTTADLVSIRLQCILKRIDRSNAPKLIGKDKWGSLVDKHRPSILASANHHQFANALNHLFHDSGISHFHYVTDREWSFWHIASAMNVRGLEKEVAHVGIVPKEIDGKWYVRGILEGSPADHSAIEVGDELVSVDGLPFQQIDSFKGKEGKDVQMILKRSAEAPYRVTLRPIRESLHKATQRAIMKSIRTIDSNGKRIAYMHGWTMVGDGEEYDRLIELQEKVDGLILDYRDGVGGSPWAALRFFGDDSDGADAGSQTWGKPTIILTADGTRSAKEIVVNTLKKNNRAVLVGTPTPGHVTTVAAFEAVGTDGLLFLPGRKLALEGKPTMPHFRLDRDLRYLQGEDEQMSFALDLLSALIDHPKPQLAPSF